MRRVTAPEWVRHAIWYHVYPLGFVGAPRRNPDAGASVGSVEHRLRQVGAWFDYVVELGANGLLLGPVFESETHGYDTVDYYRIDRRLGDDGDFAWLLEESRRRGLRVVVDGVFNHVGRAFGPFADVVERGPESEHADWFRIEWGDTARDGFRYATFEGHERLVALNHDEPEVLDLIVDVACHWLAAGVDGFRLDAAYAVPPAFWRSFTERVGAVFPDAWLMGEVIHGDYAAFVDGSGIDSVTQYELWKAIWSALNDRNLYELAHALERHDGFAARLMPHTFLGNHDVTRIVTQLQDARHLPHALVVLFTVAGTPSIYAGDEQAFRGRKYHRPGGDDEIRPAFPPTPEHLADAGWSTYRLHQELIAFRRRHPGLASARTEVLHLANEQIVYRSSDGQDAVTVVLNLSSTVAEAPLDDDGALTVEAGNGHLHGSTISMPPQSWALLTGRDQ